MLLSVKYAHALPIIPALNLFLSRFQDCLYLRAKFLCEHSRQFQTERSIVKVQLCTKKNMTRIRNQLFRKVNKKKRNNSIYFILSYLCFRIRINFLIRKSFSFVRINVESPIIDNFFCAEFFGLKFWLIFHGEVTGRESR